ncbi:GMC oxidoreductase [Epithele typhae]|uniref:GMC oxidoreductase n=1 Tax=Epithele typhae TaxID=378194 RepID=UPI002007D6CB|nr:GMC oxidoreductase [Epithele typhae]KAH9940732.1 GMC oxidoreductase [Epithele typhae]
MTTMQRRQPRHSLSESYDFVIVGGGTAGLALAARLSEDSNHTVLVLEAGESGDAVADQVTARRLGAMNGMYHIRPSKIEVDAWSTLIGGDSRWNWDSLLSAMDASETFDPPSSDLQTTGNIQYVASSHGTSGPIQAGYVGYIPPIVSNWSSTLATVGISATSDAYSGSNWGSYISVLSINPANWTRSYSRSGYIDPLPPRSNLAILPGATVTRIVFNTSNSSNLTATAVEWAASASAPRQIVGVTKEVILAGGTIGSPQVLQLSGVGPSDVLKAAGVNVLLDLPGVGQHLQDHISTQVSFKSNIETPRDMYNNKERTDAAFNSYVNTAVAYVTASTLLGDSAATLASQIAANYSAQAALVPSSDSGVVLGFEAIYNQTLAMLTSNVAQVEILLGLNAAGSVGVQTALQHPFSQGRLYITTSNPFTSPTIDPQYLSHAADTVIFREGLKLARTIGNTAPLSENLGEEISPGTTNVNTDDEWDAWLANNFGTEYHPSSSCAMLPREQGGVVDGDLKVYGLANVRVADASVFPNTFSAHVGASLY